MSYTVEEIRIGIKAAEHSIYNELRALDAMGVKVTDVNLTRVDVIGREDEELVAVDLDVRL